MQIKIYSGMVHDRMLNEGALYTHNPEVHFAVFIYRSALLEVTTIYCDEWGEILAKPVCK